MMNATQDVPADRAGRGRVVIILVNLAALAAYVLWALTLSTESPNDATAQCVICFSPRDTALIYSVLFALPVMIVSLVVGLRRYGRRPKVRNPPVPLSSTEPALVDAAYGLAVGLVVMVLAFVAVRLVNTF